MNIQQLPDSAYTYWILEDDEVMGEIAEPKRLPNNDLRGKWIGIVRFFRVDEVTGKYSQSASLPNRPGLETILHPDMQIKLK